MTDAWPWLGLGLLGAYHGVNPGMGWLLAVARGLQEGRRRAVLAALLPIGVGHEAAVAVAVGLVAVAQVVASPGLLRALAAATLIAFGVYRFARPRAHPRWGGLRIGPPELALWSFLMSSAHGAGLMLMPIVLGLPSPIAADVTDIAAVDAAAVLVHGASTLLVMGLVAVLVYEKLGVGILRRAWINFDLLWAAAVVAAGLATLFT